MKTRNVVFAIIILYFTQLNIALADVKPASLFKDHMVLQYDMANPVWGTAEPGEKVTVKINGQSHSVVTGKDGNWIIKLDKLTTGGPYTLIISRQK